MSPSPSSADDIRHWGYCDDPEPQQDFDLLITGWDHERLFVSLAADPACPKKRFFLSCLYLFIGDAVRTNYQVHSKKDVDRLLDYAEDIGDEVIQEWLARSRRLTADPESFEYDLWCWGGYASDV